jgi:hypothetical protein
MSDVNRLLFLRIALAWISTAYNWPNIFCVFGAIG